MNRKQEIWIGELIRCWEALAPTDDTTRKVLAELIGFAWQAGADESETMAAPVPEPGTMALFLGGAGALAAWRRRRGAHGPAR